MPQQSSPIGKSKVWLRRLDSLASDLNPLLVVFAIGLVVLNLTCLIGQDIVDRLPPVTRVVYEEQSATPPGLPAGLPILR